jgi:uncharacterized protein (TIGR02452 family)
MMRNPHDREKRIKQFEELRFMFQTGLYDALNVQPAELILADTIKSVPYGTQPTIEYRQATSTHAAMFYDEPAILIFGSAKHPGGGVERGSKAQEEDIALVSTWFFHAEPVKGFYQDREASALNSDKMLYAENGYILSDDYNRTIVPHKVSFIGAAAPNLTGLREQQRLREHARGITDDAVYALMEIRVQNLLMFLQSRGKKTVILGAWGCGVFGLDLKRVAGIFAKSLKTGMYSGTAVFAIPHAETLQVFKDEIGPCVCGK